MPNPPRPRPNFTQPARRYDVPTIPLRNMPLPGRVDPAIRHAETLELLDYPKSENIYFPSKGLALADFVAETALQDPEIRATYETARAAGGTGETTRRFVQALQNKLPTYWKSRAEEVAGHLLVQEPLGALPLPRGKILGGSRIDQAKADLTTNLGEAWRFVTDPNRPVPYGPIFSRLNELFRAQRTSRDPITRAGPELDSILRGIESISPEDLESRFRSETERKMALQWRAEARRKVAVAWESYLAHEQAKKVIASYASELRSTANRRDTVRRFLEEFPINTPTPTSFRGTMLGRIMSRTVDPDVLSESGGASTARQYPEQPIRPVLRAREVKPGSVAETAYNPERAMEGSAYQDISRRRGEYSFGESFVPEHSLVDALSGPLAAGDVETALKIWQRLSRRYGLAEASDPKAMLDAIVGSPEALTALDAPGLEQLMRISGIDPDPALARAVIKRISTDLSNPESVLGMAVFGVGDIDPIRPDAAAQIALEITKHPEIAPARQGRGSLHQAAAKVIAAAPDLESLKRAKSLGAALLGDDFASVVVKHPGDYGSYSPGLFRGAQEAAADIAKKLRHGDPLGRMDQKLLEGIAWASRSEVPRETGVTRKPPVSLDDGEPVNGRSYTEKLSSAMADPDHEAMQAWIGDEDVRRVLEMIKRDRPDLGDAEAIQESIRLGLIPEPILKSRWEQFQVLKPMWDHMVADMLEEGVGPEALARLRSMGARIPSYLEGQVTQLPERIRTVAPGAQYIPVGLDELAEELRREAGMVAR